MRAGESLLRFCQTPVPQGGTQAFSWTILRGWDTRSKSCK
ncbi:hypothetical protein EK904_012764 [Melospiza melodia maxima]|nr:hypothetical protein EK904_012764 [Melospiza melodia maxima]